MLKEAHSPSVCLAQLREPGNLSCVVQHIDGVSEPSANGITVWTMYVTYGHPCNMEPPKMSCARSPCHASSCVQALLVF